MMVFGFESLVGHSLRACGASLECPRHDRPVLVEARKPSGRSARVLGSLGQIEDTGLPAGDRNAVSGEKDDIL
jgi:hypothetical protein